MGNATLVSCNCDVESPSQEVYRHGVAEGFCFEKHAGHSLGDNSRAYHCPFAFYLLLLSAFKSGKQH